METWDPGAQTGVAGVQTQGPGLPSPAPEAVVSPSGELVVGQVVAGCFRVEGELGRGGMGVVYRAFHLKLGRPVALKLHRSGSGADMMRLQREAQAMARLSHPHVLGVYDVGMLGSHVFIAMEFIDGGSARAWLKARPGWRDALRMCMRAGEGLAAAHAAGLVHRDFKPDNILVSRSGQVKVADFGLARATGETEMVSVGSPSASSNVLASPLTATGAVMGTPAYMAPEQFGGAVVDARADQFAFCVVLHEALYGVRPFAGSTPGELLYAASMGKVQAAPQGSPVPEEVRQVMLRGLAPDPGMRYGSVAALLADLRRVRTGPKTAVVVAAAGVAVLLLGGAGVATATMWPDRSDPDVASEPDVASHAADAAAKEPNVRVEPAELTDEEKLAVTQAQEQAKANVSVAERDALVGELSEIDIHKDGQKILEAVEAVEKTDGSWLRLGMELAEASKKERGGALRPPPESWDGRSTLICGPTSGALEVRGMTIEVKGAAAFDVGPGCTLHIVDCNVKAPIAVSGSLATDIRIRGGSFDVSDALVDLTMTRLELRNVKMTSSPAVAIKLSKTRAMIINSEIRGDSALLADFRSQVDVVGGRLEGDPTAITATFESVVRIDGTELEGATNATTQARIEKL